MSSKTQNLIATVSIFLLIVILGCASFQSALVPCWISPAAIKYANTKPNVIFPWTTLFDAHRISAKMDYVHTVNQIKDTLEYEYLRGITRFHIAAGEELRAALFDPTGPIGLFVTTTLGASAGALLLSKPSDRKKIKQLEAEKNSKEGS